jgi:predicted NUDIX family NTP pyrophosphohydrolase
MSPAGQAVVERFMPKISAGLLLYRRTDRGLEVLLVHPGGPFFRNKDSGAWSIPKGEVAPGEDLRAAARREFFEELGASPDGELLPLSPIRQKGGKTVHAFAVEGDLNTAAIHSNAASIEWPPRSGRFIEVPEVDRVEFFDVAEAERRVNPAQVAFIRELIQRLVE